MIGAAKVLGVLGIATALLGAYEFKLYQARQEVRQEYAGAEAYAKLEHERLVRQGQVRNEEIADGYRHAAEKEAALGAATRRELERVRSAAAVRGGDAASEPGASGRADEAAATFRRLLGEGAELAEEGRGRLGEVSQRLSWLQEWVRKQCGSKPPE